ncbi:YbaB/EbfC family nucleoid-associated protein [Nocardioides bigeumensis]|jgi:DNA-binding YbaB/EbfC family protein|uniref:Nucleoid-associated protein GCM10009843_36550 n=1 Tax=Nocardioides bigeumensis TaxID=433657 RepID=A0ABN2YU58_9ACTN
MSQNPFESLGAGGFDMNALLQQAQQLQEQLASAQDRLADTTVEGEVGGGTVKVTLTGTGELKAITIKQGVVDGSDDESLEELGDLIVAAYRDAKAKADDLVGEQMNPFGATGLMGPGVGGEGAGPVGFGLPPGPSGPSGQ